MNLKSLQEDGHGPLTSGATWSVMNKATVETMNHNGSQYDVLFVAGIRPTSGFTRNKRLKLFQNLLAVLSRFQFIENRKANYNYREFKYVDVRRFDPRRLPFRFERVPSIEYVVHIMGSQSAEEYSHSKSR